MPGTFKTGFVAAPRKLHSMQRIYEGAVECIEDDEVSVRLLSQDEEVLLTLPLSTFEGPRPVEVGCTFDACAVIDQSGQTTWRNRVHEPVEISPEEIAKWRAESIEFTGSGL
jgi:hypothetical protein